MNRRCGKCENCERVANVRQQALKAIAHRPGNGEDVREVWNAILEDNPCLDPQYEEMA